MDNYYLEYSPIQKSFHIDTMERIQTTNRDTLVRGVAKETGYIIIAGPDTMENILTASTMFEAEFGRL